MQSYKNKIINAEVKKYTKKTIKSEGESNDFVSTEFWFLMNEKNTTV